MPNLTPTIDYEILKVGQEQWGDDGSFTVPLTMKCDWKDRHRLALQLMGGLSINGTFLAPQSYQDLSAAKVRSIGIQPMPAQCVQPLNGDKRVFTIEQSNGDPGFAMLDVEYRTPDANSGETVDEETIITESLEPTSEYLSTGAEGFYWSPNANPTEGSMTDDIAIPLEEDEAPGRQFRSFDWVYTKHQVLSLPNELIEFTDSVNVAAVTSRTLGYTFDKETLLYKPPTFNRAITVDGAQAWTWTARFGYKPQGWNKFWRNDPNVGGFVPMFYRNGEDNYTEYRPIQTNDFTRLVG